MIKKCLKLNLQSLISFLQTKMAEAEAQVSKSLWFLSLGFLVVIFKRFASGNCCNILIANKINVEPQNKIHLSSLRHSIFFCQFSLLDYYQIHFPIFSEREDGGVSQCLYGKREEIEDGKRCRKVGGIRNSQLNNLFTQ